MNTLNEVIHELPAHISDDTNSVIESHLINHFDRSFSLSLLRRSVVHSAESDEIRSLLHTLCIIEENLQPHIRPAFHPIAQQSLDELRGRMDELSHGLSLSQNKQVSIIESFVSRSKSFILIDNTIYENIHVDWTPRFLQLLSDISKRDNIDLTYIIPCRSEKYLKSKVVSKKACKFRNDLESFGWKVIFSDFERALNDEQQFEGFEAKILELFDKEYQITMETVDRFSGDAPVTTRIGRVDELTSAYCDALIRTPIQFDERPPPNDDQRTD